MLGSGRCAGPSGELMISADPHLETRRTRSGNTTGATGVGGGSSGEGPRTSQQIAAASHVAAAAKSARRKRRVLIGAGAAVFLASGVLVYSIRQESGEARDPDHDQAVAEVAPGSGPAGEEPAAEGDRAAG